MTGWSWKGKAMQFDSRTFRKVLGCFATGVTVATTMGEAGEPLGVTVSSFTSVSLDPPLILFCLANSNQYLDTFRKPGIAFALNILRAEQREISIRFASREGDKWKGLTHIAGKGGAPVLPGCLAVLECRTEAVHAGGDHQIIVGRVIGLEHSEGGQPLAYFRGSYADLGTSLP